MRSIGRGRVNLRENSHNPPFGRISSICRTTKTDSMAADYDKVVDSIRYFKWSVESGHSHRRRFAKVHIASLVDAFGVEAMHLGEQTIQRVQAWIEVSREPRSTKQMSSC